jgi:DNA mismatch repair protein MutH
MEMHWKSFFTGAAVGAVFINAFAGELGKVIGAAFTKWAKSQRGRFLSGDQKRLLWLTTVGGGLLVVNNRIPGSPVIWSPQRGTAFQIRGELQPLIECDLLRAVPSAIPGHQEYHLTDLGAERVEVLPGYEDEFPTTESDLN